MRIQTSKVSVFKTILTCSRVNCTGNYEFAGVVETLYPTRAEDLPTAIYGHKCTVCGDEQNFEKRFPQITYEEEEGNSK
jgi:hypothetical protein